MKKALIVRYGAYGDIIHMSWLPRALKEDGYDIVDVETNFKGYQLLAKNPYIDNIKMFEPTNPNYANLPLSMIMNLWDLAGLEYDKYINLFRSLEYAVSAMEDQSIYYMDIDCRKKFGDKNYYDVTAKAAEMPHWIGRINGEVYFTPEEESKTLERMARYKDKFVVVFNLNGTGRHKVLKSAKELAKKILDEIPNSYVITTGDNTAIDIDHVEGRTETWIGKIPFREALLRIKHVDCIVGCESGIMCGASMWGTPAVQIMTAASLNNHVKYALNDHSIQSPAYCSPCFKGPYKYLGCPFKDDLPLCVDVDAETIMEKVREVHSGKN